MLKTGDRIHFLNPEFTDKRVLHTGTVQALEDGEVVADFPPPSFPVEADGEFIVFYESRRQFVQHMARIAEVRETEPMLVARLELVGDTAPAEGREHYRVTTISADVTATLGDEQECKVVDVSSTGFAVLSTQACSIGESLQASIKHEDEVCSGLVVVQSVLERRDSTRYGLRYVNQGDTPSQFESGLNQISLAVQREQLARQGVDG